MSKNEPAAGQAWSERVRGLNRLRSGVSRSLVGRSIATLHDLVNRSDDPAPVSHDGASSIVEANFRFAADVIHTARENLSADSTQITYAEEVISFFLKGIRGRMFQNYVNYGLRSLTRGSKLVEQYCPPGQQPARYLDVGCAYGGAPVAMAKRGVRYAVGLEFDERLLKLSRSLAIQEDVDDQVKFISGDLTEYEDVSALGTFDLVTCIDVLEHVLDPESAIKNLAVLTGTSGTVIVDVPNPLSFEMIERDPHHHLFGSVLLDRDSAIRVFDNEFPKARYTVGYFHSLEWYTTRLEAAGFRVAVLDSPPCDSDAVARTRSGIESLRGNFARASSKWPDWRRELVGSALDGFYDSAGNYKVLATTNAAKFQLRHAVPVYHIRCSIE